MSIGTTLALHNAAFADPKGAMLPIKETDIAANGVAGPAGGPLVIFLHGWPEIGLV